MKFTKRGLRRVLNEVAIMGDVQPHRTLSGEMVPFGCPECVDDIELRIEDAVYNRDSSGRGSAQRTHYNGLLQVYRRMLRGALKDLEKELPPETVEDIEIIAELLPEE